MTVKGGTTPACAACKYQRRKCTPTCPLAPYFPASQPKMFQNVHRLFGVSNVTKTLQNIKSKDVKDDAVRSIIYEAEMRARFPVHGCCGVMAQLHHQLRMAYQELNFVCAHIDACRERMTTDADGGGSLCGSRHEQPSLTLEPYSDTVMSADFEAQMNLSGIQGRSVVDFKKHNFGYDFEPLKLESCVQSKLGVGHAFE